MSKNELTFDEAWEYLVYLTGFGLSKAGIADYIECDRKFVSGTINGIKNNSTGNTLKIPERCHAKVIELAEVIQMEAWRDNKKKDNEQT